MAPYHLHRTMHRRNLARNIIILLTLHLLLLIGYKLLTLFLGLLFLLLYTNIIKIITTSIILSQIPMKFMRILFIIIIQRNPQSIFRTTLQFTLLKIFLSK